MDARWERRPERNASALVIKASKSASTRWTNVSWVTAGVLVEVLAGVEVVAARVGAAGVLLVLAVEARPAVTAGEGEVLIRPVRYNRARSGVKNFYIKKLGSDSAHSRERCPKNVQMSRPADRGTPVCRHQHRAVRKPETGP